MPGSGHQTCIHPSASGPGAVGFLLVVAELERGHAQFRQRKRRLRRLGLDLATEQLVADPLDLLSDVQFGGVEVDQFPGETEYLALAQAQDQSRMSLTWSLSSRLVPR